MKPFPSRHPLPDHPSLQTWTLKLMLTHAVQLGLCRDFPPLYLGEELWKEMRIFRVDARLTCCLMLTLRDVSTCFSASSTNCLMHFNTRKTYKTAACCIPQRTPESPQTWGAPSVQPFISTQIRSSSKIKKTCVSKTKTPAVCVPLEAKRLPTLDSGNHR